MFCKLLDKSNIWLGHYDRAVDDQLPHVSASGVICPCIFDHRLPFSKSEIRKLRPSLGSVSVVKSPRLETNVTSYGIMVE